MPFPAGTIEIQLRRLTGVNLAALNGGALGNEDRPYVIAYVAGRFMGRSSRIAAAPGNVDLAQAGGTHGAIWSHKLRINAGDTIDIVVEIWNDRHNNGPVRIHQINHQLTVPNGGAGGGGPNWNDGNPQNLTHGANPGLDYRVTIAATPGQVLAAPVALGHHGGPPVLVVAHRIVEVTIVDVLGLCQPSLPAGSVVPNPPPANSQQGGRLSRLVVGYKSEDDRGRIFINRNLLGQWTANQQSIVLRAQLTSQAVNLNNAEVRWTVRYPDDPSDDHTDVHRYAGVQLDGTDYINTTDGDATRQHNGAAFGGDDTAGAVPNPPWVACAGSAMRNANVNSTITRVQPMPPPVAPGAPGWFTEVELNCPDAGGDSLIVEVTLETVLNPAPDIIIGDRTGVMTMWKRVHVHYYRMAAHGAAGVALALPVRRIPRHFEAAFVQLDFEPEVMIPGPNTRLHMAANSNQLEQQSTAYINNVFAANGPGRFCLVSAKLPYPVGAGGAIVNNNVMLNVGRGAMFGMPMEYVTVPGFGALNQHRVHQVQITVGGNNVSFTAIGHTNRLFPPRRRLYMLGHDVQDQFTGHDSDGSIDHAYQNRRFYHPRGCHNGAGWVGGNNGYGAPSPVQTTTTRPGGFYTSGISPGVRTGGVEYFAGRTMIFSHHGTYQHGPVQQKLEATITHELTHAFGMPHKCAMYDYKTPRAQTCSMNYNPNWMTNDHDDQLVPNTSGNVGFSLCALHIHAVRRVHLEDNLGLRHLGWV